MTPNGAGANQAIAMATSSGLKLEINEFTLLPGSEKNGCVEDADVDQCLGEPSPILVKVDELHVTAVC